AAPASTPSAARWLGYPAPVRDVHVMLSTIGLKINLEDKDGPAGSLGRRERAMREVQVVRIFPIFTMTIDQYVDHVQPGLVHLVVQSSPPCHRARGTGLHCEETVRARVGYGPARREGRRLCHPGDQEHHEQGSHQAETCP